MSHSSLLKRRPTPVSMPGQARAVVDYWQRWRVCWFSKDAHFDLEFRERFLPLHLAAVRRDGEVLLIEAWADDGARQRAAELPDAAALRALIAQTAPQQVELRKL